jgi:F0F1-type ATP synthase assembly protein I
MKQIHRWMGWLFDDYAESLDWHPRRLHWLVLIVGAILGYVAGLMFIR